jgi:hypothetical protein
VIASAALISPSLVAFVMARWILAILTRPPHRQVSKVGVQIVGGAVSWVADGRM